MIPLGGSDVTLIPFYSKVTGKVSVGIDVSHNLNSVFSTFSINFSISIKNLGAIWQFYKTIHLPFYIANSKNFLAFFSYPYPNERTSTFFPFPKISLNLSISPKGSAPYFNMNIIGILFLVFR